MKREVPNSEPDISHELAARSSKSTRGSRARGGFTLIELLVSIAIFVFMTALVISRYGTFNNSTLLTNMAYDIALTMRTAQTYGLSVRTSDASSDQFLSGYGVHFDLSSAQQFILFADGGPSASPNGIYDLAGDGVPVNTYSLARGATVSSMCVGRGAVCDGSGSVTVLDITFRRPDPNAIICSGGSCGSTPWNYAEIRISAAGNTGTRTIVVRQNGQISVSE